MSLFCADIREKSQIIDALTNLCVERLFRRLSKSLMFFLIDCWVFDVVVVVSYLIKGIDKTLIDGDNKQGNDYMV